MGNHDHIDNLFAQYSDNEYLDLTSVYLELSRLVADSQSGTDSRLELLPLLLRGAFDGTNSDCGYFDTLPSITGIARESIGDDLIQLWRIRAENTRNRLIAARYWDAAWDLGNGGRNVKDAQNAIKCYVSAASQSIAKPIDRLPLLTRAIVLAVQLKDDRSVELTYSALRALAEQCTLEALGVWIAPLEIIAKHKTLRPFRDRAVVDVRRRFSSLIESGLYFQAEICLRHLLDALPGPQNRPLRIALLRQFQPLLKEKVLDDSKGVGAHRVLMLSKLFGKEKCYDDADVLRVRSEMLMRESLSEMKSIESRLSIDKASLDADISSLLVQKEAYTALVSAAISLIPEIEGIRGGLEQKSKSSIAMNLFPITIVGPEGSSTSEVGTFDNDPDAHVMLELARIVQLNGGVFSIFLRSWREKNRCDLAVVLPKIMRCELLSANSAPFILAGLAAYSREDWMAAIHLLIPQIEAAARELIAVLGGPKTRTGRRGEEFRSLTDILADKRVEGAIEEGWIKFLSGIFNDSCGINLRNRVSHGVALAGEMTESHATLVVWALIAISAMQPGFVTFD